MARPLLSLPKKSADSENSENPKRNKEAMDRDEIEAIVRKAIAAAKPAANELRERLSQNLKLYKGDKDVTGLPQPPPKDERSTYVSRDVRDVVHSMVAWLCRVFVGNQDAVVEYEPVGPEDVESAQEATEYVNYKLRASDGARKIIETLYAAGIYGLSGIKVSSEDVKAVKETTYLGMTQDEFDGLTALPGDASSDYEELGADDEAPEPAPKIEVIEHSKRRESRPDPVLPDVAVEVEVIDVKVRETTTRRALRFDMMPPEERVLSDKTTDLDACRFAMHVRQATIGELVAMGYDGAVLEDLPSGEDFDLEEAKAARSGETVAAQASSLDPTQREILYGECYIIADFDGDGIPSRYRVCVGGTNATMLTEEPERVDDIPWAEFCFFPVPYSATGRGIGDDLGDVQIAKSQLHRGVFDSLGQAIFPPRAYNENVIDDTDMQSTSPGVNIPVAGSPTGQIQEMTRTFMGKEAMPVIGLMDEVKENRTGISKAAAGLDPDALQSTTKAAVAATVSGSQAQIEQVARVIAEGMRRLFRLMLKESVRSYNAPDIVRLNGKWTKFDPRGWNPDMDTKVNVALGRGNDEQRAVVLQGVMAAQKEVIMAIAQSGGALPPIATLQHFYNAQADYLRLNGFVNPARYWADPASLPPPQPAPPKPDPAMVLAEAELEKARAQAFKARIDGLVNLFDVLLKDDRERDKIDADTAVAVADLQAQGATAAAGQAQARAAATTERARDYLSFLDSAAQVLVGLEQSQSQLAGRGAAAPAASPAPGPVQGGGVPTPALAAPPAG